MVGQAVPKPNPYLTPQGLEARKQALIQKMTMPPGGYGMAAPTPTAMPPYHPFNPTANIPGNVDMSPPIQSIYTGAAAGSAQSGTPGAQMSNRNPNIVALANVRGGYG